MSLKKILDTIVPDVTPKIDGRVLTLLAGLGVLTIASYLAVPVHAAWKHIIRPRKNLAQRYGGNWALVTGGGDGIGEAYCYELASSGFNIVIVSRTLEKMEKVAQNLRDKYKVQVKIIQFDFANLGTKEQVEDLYSKLDQIKEDVCIVANNAGKAHMNPIHDHSVDMCFNMVNVNVNAVLFLSRYFFAKFKARFDASGKRSAMINVSSVAAVYPSPNVSVYSGTKAFDRLFSLSA